MTTKIIPNVLSYLKINSRIITRTQKILSLFFGLIKFRKTRSYFWGLYNMGNFSQIHTRYKTDSTFSVELKNKRHKAFFLKSFNFVYHFLTYIFVVLWMRYGKNVFESIKKNIAYR